MLCPDEQPETNALCGDVQAKTTTQPVLLPAGARAGLRGWNFLGHDSHPLIVRFVTGLILCPASPPALVSKQLPDGHKTLLEPAPAVWFSQARLPGRWQERQLCALQDRRQFLHFLLQPLG